MRYIPMSILEYRFNEQGLTQQIVVAFQNYQGNEQFNARVNLTDEYVKTRNENLTLDNLSREQIENFARLKLRDWLMTQREVEEPEEDDGLPGNADGDTIPDVPEE